MQSPCRLQRAKSLRGIRLWVITWAALLALLAALPALAQSSPYKAGSPLLMWKVSSKTNSAYVLGSVHLGDKSLYPLPAVIEDAFQSANLLIVEVDLRKVDPMSAQQMMLQSAVYPPGDDLFHHISPATRAKLEAFLSTYGLPSALVAQMRAWMLGTMIQILPMMQNGLNPSEGIDTYFLNKTDDKRVDQLEDAQWQIKLLSEMPESVSDHWLSSALDEAQNPKERWQKLANYWRTGDADGLDAMLSESSAKENADERAFDRRLREERNPHMADRLEECLHSTDSCFMVVGAAHVIGKEGIVSLMRQRGYQVEQAQVGEEPAAGANSKKKAASANH
jgi:uncharacterized protein YbaP (TraB family)